MLLKIDGIRIPLSRRKADPTALNFIQSILKQDIAAKSSVTTFFTDLDLDSGFQAKTVSGPELFQKADLDPINLPGSGLVTLGNSTLYIFFLIISWSLYGYVISNIF